VYGTPFINKKTFLRLENAHIPIVYADNYRFTFTHAKFFLIDDTLILSTGNLAHTSFTKNRDIMWISTDASLLAFLENLFLADFAHEKYIPKSLPMSIVTSPENSRKRISNMILDARSTIDLYVQTLEDPELIKLLASAQSR
jgi:phosphatidylserine/phosphatidylglycerophosphate/cardiolipin synthase-like enzyme